MELANALLFKIINFVNITILKRTVYSARKIYAEPAE